MEIKLVLDDENADSYLSLWSWLTADERLFPYARQVVQSRPHELGGAFDAIAIALGSGGTGVALAQCLQAWLTSQRSHLRVKIRSEQREVELEASNVDDAKSIIEKLLDSSE